MEYPKPVMKLGELMEMGFPREFLMLAYRSKGNNFASKINPLRDNSGIFFETAGFEKWRLKQIDMQVKSMPRGGILN